MQYWLPGRDDYLWINQTDWSIRAWLNSGSSDLPSWSQLNDGKPVAAGVRQQGAAQGIRLADLDGDGRDDYICTSNVWGMAA